MQLEFVPRSMLPQYLSEGWGFISDYEYRKTDWAVLMERSDNASKIPFPVATRLASGFATEKHEKSSNKRSAAISRNIARYGIKAKASGTDELIERNLQLQKRIDEISGYDDVLVARHAFGLSLQQARAFLLIVQRGVADYEMLQAAIIPEEELLEINRPDEAVRSCIKRMRKKIRPLNIDVSVIYGFGYEMVQDARDRARSLLSNCRRALNAS